MDDKQKYNVFVSQNRQTLEAFRKELFHGLSLATRDFLQVHSLYRNCYGSSNIALKREIVQSGMAEDLQYIDILKQKIEHVADLHEQAVWDDTLLPLSGAIFKVNAFQLKLADFDFLKTVESIQAKILGLRHLIWSPATIQSLDDAHFTHTVKVSEVMQSVSSRLLAMAVQYLPPDAGSLHLPISSTYSMESERFVLQWFVHNYEHADYGDLLQAYRNIRQGISVELF